MQAYIKLLIELIETTYAKNKNQKVVLIAHSMGNPTILYVLNHQSQSWKDKYIHAHIALAGPWGGAAKTLRLMASGKKKFYIWILIFGKKNLTYVDLYP